MNESLHLVFHGDSVECLYQRRVLISNHFDGDLDQVDFESGSHNNRHRAHFVDSVQVSHLVLILPVVHLLLHLLFFSHFSHFDLLFVFFSFKQRFVSLVSRCFFVFGRLTGFSEVLGVEVIFFFQNSEHDASSHFLLESGIACRLLGQLVTAELPTHCYTLQVRAFHLHT